MYYAIRIVMLMALAAAAALAVELARADSEFRRGTPESVKRAIELAPGNTEYLLFRALQIDYDGGDASPMLERAAELNPLSSTPRIRLGLAAETRGDSVNSEKWLLDAARVDHQFEPAWTLANYYFRRGKTPEFWKWMRAALDVSYGDRRPAFDLCWRTSDDAREILGRAIPGRREVIAAYLSYLLQTRRIAAAAPVALKLAAFKNRGDRPLLNGASDELIAANDARGARQLWRVLYGETHGVFHGDFEAPRIGHGFGWRSGDIPGVSQLDLTQPSRRRIIFDGREPESCELLRQFVALEPGKRYTLTWESRADGLKSAAGIEWRIAGEHAPVASHQLSFMASSELMPLILQYDRPPGEVRVEGFVELWGIAIR